VAGTINQTAESAGYSAHESIEVMLRYAGIVRSSDNQRWHCYLFQPRPAVKRDEPSDRATHGWGAIGGQYGLPPFGLLPGKSYHPGRLRF
jgi:hypothetical protein